MKAEAAEQIQEQPQRKKMGRPTDCVKSREVKIRLTEAQFERLETWAKNNSITTAEAVRRAIDAATEAK